MLKQFVSRMTTTPVVGVDIGSSALKVVELEHRGGRSVLRRCAVARVGGDDRAGCLRRALDPMGRTTHQVAMGLASPEAIVRPFDFPAMPRKELVSAIRLEAEQSILNGHPMGEMAVDWHTLPLLRAGRIEGLLAVVPKSAVASRLEMAKSAGLKPVIVDVEGLALWNAYWALVGSRGTEPRREAVLLVNVGVATTNLVIAKGPDELLLVRDLRLGGGAIADGRQADWLAEIRDSLAYARSKTGLRELEAVSVSGGFGSRAIEPLQSAMDAPITQWNPLERLARDERSPDVDLALGPLLAVAVGLALRQPS